MQIKSLSINNLRSHRSTSMNGLQRINMILGQNFAGKSTILDALCYGFRGVCRGIDEGGRGGDGLVSTDINGRSLAKSFSVVIETDNGTITRNGPGDGPRSNVQKIVDGIFAKASSRMVDPRILVESTRFLDMPPAEQKAVIQQLTGAEVPREAVQEALGDDFPHIEPLWPEDLTAAPVSTLDSIEKYVREQRRLLKREVEFLKPPDMSGYVEDLRKMTADQAESLAERIKAKLDSLKAEYQKDAGGLEREIDRLGELNSDVEALKMRAKSAPKAVDTKADINDSEKAIGKLNEELLALPMPGDVGDARARLAALQKDTSKCYVCRRALDKAKRTKLVKALENEIGSEGTGDRNSQQIKTEIEAIQTYILECQTRQSQYDSAVENRAEAKKQLDTAVTRQKAQQALVDSMKSEAPVSNELPDRIAKGDQKLIDVRTYVQARRLYERQTKELEAATAKRDAFERLCTALGPKGNVRAEMIQSGGTDFAATVSQIAGPMNLDFAIEPEPFRLLSRGRDVSLLSTSQRLRLGFAIQVAVSRITGLGFVCVDNVDWLDTSGRSALSKAMAGVPEQVFLCATSKIPDDQYVRPDPAKTPGWSFYLVKGDGDSSQVQQL